MATVAWIVAGIVLLLVLMLIWAFRTTGAPGKAQGGEKSGMTEGGGMVLVILVVGILLAAGAMHGH